jgi:hypothetical protein
VTISSLHLCAHPSPACSILQAVDATDGMKDEVGGVSAGAELHAWELTLCVQAHPAGQSGGQATARGQWRCSKVRGRQGKWADTRS